MNVIKEAKIRTPCQCAFVCTHIVDIRGLQFPFKRHNSLGTVKQ